MSQAYVAFYWTLPVPRRGFVSLPKNADAAARRSRTIRYQMERIRRYVQDEKGRLVEEQCFMELAADRGTDGVEPTLNELATLCRHHKAVMIYVDFAEYYDWRPHTFMKVRLKELGVATETLLPTPIYIDYREFDPVKHFRAWRQRHTVEGRELRRVAEAEMRRTVDQLPEGAGRWLAAAKDLNKRNITTGTGRRWSSEGVRKAFTRPGAAADTKADTERAPQ